MGQIKRGSLDLAERGGKEMKGWWCKEGKGIFLDRNEDEGMRVTLPTTSETGGKKTSVCSVFRKIGHCLTVE